VDRLRLPSGLVLLLAATAAGCQSAAPVATDSPSSQGAAPVKSSVSQAAIDQIKNNPGIPAAAKANIIAAMEKGKQFKHR